MSYEELIISGVAASRADNIVEAIKIFQRASATDPTAALPQFLLGAEFAALGDMTQAEAAFANATRLAPEFPMARYQLGLVQFSSGRAAMGLLTWQPLLDLPDTDPLPHIVNGFAALAQDRFEEALAFYEQGLARNTANPPLSGDIEKVMAGIRDAMARNAEAERASNADAESADAADASSNAHILLANYQQNGPGH